MLPIHFTFTLHKVLWKRGCAVPLAPPGIRDPALPNGIHGGTRLAITTFPVRKPERLLFT